VASGKDMTSAPLSRTPALLLLGGLLLAVYAVCASLAVSLSSLHSPRAVALGITFDLTVTATFLVWCLGSRRGVLPSWAPKTTLGVGVIVASQVPHAPAGILGAAGIALELIIVGLIVARLPAVIRGTRAARLAGPIGALEAGFLAARLPARFAAILASEFAVVWLALTGWFRRPDPAAFSMRRTGWLMIAGVFGFLISVETAGLHYVLAMWSPIAAWIATASSVYVLLWLVADAHAIRVFPVVIADHTLWVRIGVRWRAQVPLAMISAVSEISSVPHGAAKLSLLEPSVLVELRDCVELRGPFGIRRQASKLALTIDDPARFMAEIAAASPGTRSSEAHKS
jgi:hypothetical protein